MCRQPAKIVAVWKDAVYVGVAAHDHPEGEPTVVRAWIGGLDRHARTRHEKSREGKDEQQSPLHGVSSLKFFHPGNAGRPGRLHCPSATVVRGSSLSLRWSEAWCQGESTSGKPP